MKQVLEGYGKDFKIKDWKVILNLLRGRIKVIGKTIGYQILTSGRVYGFQLMASAMFVDQTLQAYSTYSNIYGEYGDAFDIRLGLNWFPYKNHVVRMNFEYINTYRIPVGGLSLPYPVGGTGNIFYTKFSGVFLIRQKDSLFPHPPILHEARQYPAGLCRY